MNVLSFRTSPEDGLSFELLIDSQSLSELVNDGYEGIPYWNIHADLPSLPPDSEPRRMGVHIVSVCSCGEYGCGHTRCRIEKAGDQVIFREFVRSKNDKPKDLVFVFSGQNYDEVVVSIVNQANERKKVDAEQ